MKTRLYSIGIVLGVVAMQGCGGGGPSSGGHGTGGTTTGGSIGTSTGLQGNAASLAATFQVNVNTGQVSVVSQTGSLTGAARIKPGLFTGNAIGFNSTTITDLTGLGLGTKVMSVSLTNNSGQAIGADPQGNVTGLNVMFGAFVNTTGVQDQRPNTNVSTLAGLTPGFSDGATSVGKFDDPTGVAVAPNGTVYVADYANNRIRKISGGYVSTFAGTGTSAELDGVPTKAEFKGPYGVAVNPTDGSIIVADYGGDTIRRVTSTGEVNTIAGTGSAGSTNGAGNTALFTNPSDLTVDSTGNIYVTEAGSNRIRKVMYTGANPAASSSYTVSLFAGGSIGFLDGKGAAAEFNKPYGLTADTSGNVYVADYGNNAIRMIDSSADVTTIAGTGTESDLDGYGNAATFNHPVGVAFVNGALFVSEYSGLRIREVMPVPGGGSTSASWLVETLAGTGSSGDVNGAGSMATFGVPYFIAASSSSSLYLADYGKSQIRRINPSTGTFPIGTPTSSTNSSTAVALSNPTGVVDTSDLGQAPYITYSLSGPLAAGSTTASQPWNFVVPTGVTSFQFQVIVESNTSELLPLGVAMNAGSPQVDVRTFAGSSNNVGFANGTVANALFGGLVLTAMDGNGVIYVSDYRNAAIRRIDSAGNVTTIAGPSGSVGDENGTGNVASFNGPVGIAVNAPGTEIFVADSGNNEIRCIVLTGSDPTNAANWTISTIAGATTAGFADGPGTTATMNSPYGICSGPGGAIYICEFGGSRVRRLDFRGGSQNAAASWYVTTIAGDNTQTQGATGLINEQGTMARFTSPISVACDAAGNLYVADLGNQVIRRIDRTYTVTTYAGNASNGYVDGNAASAEFSFPAGLTVDSAGYLYVADETSQVIRRVSPGPNPIVETVAGNGTSGNIDGPGNTAELDDPYSVMVSPSGTLYVGSTIGGTIRLIQTVQNSAVTKARPK